MNPSRREQIKKRVMHTCQGCGSLNITLNDSVKTKPSGIWVDRFTCRNCGHLSIYSRIEKENWRVG